MSYFDIAFDAIEIVGYITIVFFIVSKFFKWYYYRSFAIFFKSLSLSHYPFIIFMLYLNAESFKNKCTICSGADVMGEGIWIMLNLIILILCPVWYLLFFSNIPKTKILEEDGILSDEEIKKWQRWKKVMLILAFMTPILYFIAFFVIADIFSPVSTTPEA